MMTVFAHDSIEATGMAEMGFDVNISYKINKI